MTEEKYREVAEWCCQDAKPEDWLPKDMLKKRKMPKSFLIFVGISYGLIIVAFFVCWYFGVVV